MNPVRLRTARLVLDQPTLDDVDRIAEYCRDPLFEHYLSTPWPYRLEDAVGFVTEFAPLGWREDAELTWAIRHPVDGFVGVVGITLARSGRPSGMLGFWIGKPFRGLGYLPEAARTAIDHVLDAGILHRIEWEAVVPNRASLAAARKLGFRYLGVRSASVPTRDDGRPESWFAELCAEESRAEKPGWP